MSFEAEELAAPATPMLLAQLEAEGRLSPEAHEAGLRLLQEVAPPKSPGPSWRVLLNRSFLAVGSTLVLVGIIFFFAYNWAKMHRYMKFALLDLALVGTIVVTLRKGLDQIEGKAALFGSIVLVGALLAVIGQTYQTGADAYSLFLAWMVLVTVWVFISKMPGAWLFWLLLANLSLGLYLKQELGFNLFEEEMMTGLASLNAAALGVWELLSPRVPWMKVRANWTSRAMYTAALAFATFALCTLVLSFRFVSSSMQLFTPLVYAALVGLGVYQYRVRKIDLLPLTNICVSLIVLSAVLMGKIANDAGFFLFITFAVLAEAAAAGFWLKGVHDHVNATQAA